MDVGWRLVCIQLSKQAGVSVDQESIYVKGKEKNHRWRSSMVLRSPKFKGCLTASCSKEVWEMMSGVKVMNPLVESRPRWWRKLLIGDVGRSWSTVSSTWARAVLPEMVDAMVSAVLV